MGHQVRDVRLPQDKLKATLSHLADAGPRDFYQGDLARSIAADIRADGGALSVEDLAAFRAHVREPLAIPYRGGKVYATPELTAGPTMAHALRLLQQSLKPAQRAGCGRLRRICAGAAGGLPRAAARTWAMPTAGARSAPNISRPACTTHFSVVDRDGNMAAVTQTLLSSLRLEIRDAAHRHRHEQRHHVVRPDAGHAPIRSPPASAASTNYTPVVARDRGRQAPRGRRLRRPAHPAVGDAAVSFVMDFGMDLDAAIHQPRIDASEGAIVIGDMRLPAEVRKALAAASTMRKRACRPSRRNSPARAW